VIGEMKVKTSIVIDADALAAIGRIAAGVEAAHVSSRRQRAPS
jgi:hypothetical protein